MLNRNSGDSYDQSTDRVASSPWVPQNIGRIPPPSVNTGAVEEVKEADSTDIIFRSLLLMIPSLRSKISRLLSD